MKDRDLVEFMHNLNPLLEPNQVLEAAQKYLDDTALEDVQVEFLTDAEAMEHIREEPREDLVPSLLERINKLVIEQAELKQEVALLRIVTTNLEYALVKEEELSNYVIEKTQTKLSRGKIKDLMAAEKAKKGSKL